MAKKLKVERKSREVIDGKLLAALEDEGTVALLVNETDLDLVIDGLDCFYCSLSPRAIATRRKKAIEMAEDLRRLRKEAFG